MAPRALRRLVVDEMPDVGQDDQARVREQLHRGQLPVSGAMRSASHEIISTEP